MLEKNKNPNALIHASSPYLLQHAYNPVEWNEWSADLLKKSQAENTLLIISIGYAACHWCHVMEHESFEKEEVAEWMNQFYVNIKVDREERPDIDAVYMNAAQLTTGRGGWPLNVIALPDGKPIFAGTYFPKDHWIKILEHFAAAWKKNPQELIEVAQKIEEGLQLMESEYFPKLQGESSQLTSDLPEKIAANIYAQLDLEKGGLDKAPKFPMPCIFDFLLNYNHYKKDEKIKNAIHATLVNMMEGGIYDQVGGGFARYSVDEYWFVPHFEKMMYDNGQLIALYSKAYAFTGIEAYQKISTETIRWIYQEMTNEEGLFYSSLDADSEGVEGKFYCFTQQEIHAIVKERPDIFCEYFSIEEEGNWEHSNILYVGKLIRELSEKHQIDPEQVKAIIEIGKEELHIYRETRIRPGLDDKCITAWNALTITGMLKAFQFSDDHFALAIAKRALDFIMQNMKQDNGLFFRNYKNKKATIPGFLDDQALLIEALTEAYRVTWDESLLLEAKQLLEKTIEHYWDEKTGSFFYAGKEQEQPVLRTKEIMDNVIPSSNSIMAYNLYILGHYFEQDEWITMSSRLCITIQDQAVKYGPYFSNWANAMLAHTHGGAEVAIIGETGPEELRALYKIPGIILMKKTGTNTQIPLLAGKPLSGSLQIYICRNKSCGLPVNNIKEAIQQIMN
jgi:uncharacterized protein YyaL (SSP411 family)